MTKEDMSLVKMYASVYDYDYTSNDLIGKIDFDIT